MLFFQNNLAQVNYWQNNLQIRSHWSGALLSESSIPKKKQGEKYYLTPFFLLSLFPQNSIKSGKVFKLYVGFNFQGVFDKLKREGLSLMYNMFKFRFGININDQFKKDCALIINNNERSRYVEKRVFNPKINNHLLKLNWNKAFLIPMKCLKKNGLNKIKIWWTSENNNIDFSWSTINKTNEFLEQTTTAQISFLFPRKSTLNFRLDDKKTTEVKLNYWYLITNTLGRPTKITPLLSENLQFQSQIKKVYSNSQPFNSFWTLTHTPIHILLSNFILLLQNFAFSYFENDLNQIRNWNQPPILIDVVTHTQDIMQKQNLKGQIIFFNKKRKTNSLIINNYQKQPKNSLQFNYYQTFLYHKLKTKNSWNFLQKKFIINRFSKTTFLTNWKSPSSEVVLTNSFNWNTIFPIQIVFQQQAVFQNTFWNQKIEFQRIEKPSKEGRITQKQQFWISFLDLRKIAYLNDFTLKKYLSWKEKWQKNYVQKIT